MELERFVRNVDEETYRLGATPHVWGIGPKGECPLVLVGEAPGETEVTKEDDFGNLLLQPFIGDAGGLLTKALSSAVIYRPGLWITNVISVRPPGNDIKSPEAQEAMRAEKEAFWAEIEWLIREKGTRVIVALGATAMSALGIRGDITTNRGSVYELDTNWRSDVKDPEAQPCDAVVVPTYHPSYVLRNGRWYERGQGKADVFLTFVEDLKRAQELVVTPYQRPVEKFQMYPKLHDVRTWIDRCFGELVALDIETTGGLSRDHAELAIFGTALSGEEAFSIPFIAQGGLPYWRPNELLEINKLINKLLNTAYFVIQNATFDIPFLVAKGYAVDYSRIKHDTLVLHHILNPELKHSLAFIVSVYGATPYWKETLVDRKKSNIQLPDDEFRSYNLRDCVVLHQVLPKLLEELDERPPSLREVYETESMKLIKPISKMMLNGIGYDKKYHAKWTKELEARTVEMEKQLRSTWKLPECFNFGSDDDMRRLLFNEVSEKHKRYKTMADKKRTDTALYATLDQQRQIVEEVEPFLVPDGFSGPRTEKTRKLQVDTKARTLFAIAIQKRLALVKKFVRPRDENLEELEIYPRQLEWLALYNEFTKAQKLLSTYSSFKTGLDGRIHSSFLIHGTATGRLASREINLQNLPRKDPTFRGVFVAAPGHLLVSADYTNLEVGTLAYESGEPKLIEAFEQGINIHDMNTRNIFGITPENSFWKPSRGVCKMIQFALQYGASVREIHRNVMTEMPNMGITFNDIQSHVAKYFQIYQTFARWYEETKRKGATTRTTTTFAGRVRTLYGNVADIEKEALNTPCQGAAAHIINRATIRIDERLEKELPCVRLVLQVHDELIFEAPVEDISALVPLIKEEMERPFDFYERRVRFPCDVEVGHNLSSLRPWGKGEANGKH